MNKEPSMTLHEQIHTGRRHSPPRLLVYGTEGIGKSSTAADAPMPIFIPTEDGLDQIDCHAFPLAIRFEDVLSALSALAGQEQDYQTVVIDTLDWLERLIWAKVCEDRGVQNIEDIGYQKGYVFALDFWRQVVDALDQLRNERGMCVVLLAHCRIEKFEDPESPAYDRYTIVFSPLYGPLMPLMVLVIVGLHKLTTSQWGNKQAGW